MMPQNTKTLQLIQLLRGVASMLVVFLHITNTYQQTYGTALLGNFFSFGGSGVDIFFVLSGFIITYTSKKYIGDPGSTFGFIKKRFVRIFPIYWIIISVLIVARLVLPQFYNTAIALTAKDLLDTYLLLPGHIMINGVSWSLTNELFFYLLFIISFFIPKKISLFLVILYTLALLAIGLKGADEAGNPYLSLVTFSMNIEFFLGVFIALMIPKIKPQFALPLIITGTLLFAVGVYCSLHNVVLFSSSLNRVVLFGVPSFFIIAGVVVYELHYKVVLHNILMKLGDASYSIYLFHLPMVAMFFKVIKKANINNTFIVYLLLLLFIVFIGFLGIAIYKRIEKPLIQLLNKKKQLA